MATCHILYCIIYDIACLENMSKILTRDGQTEVKIMMNKIVAGLAALTALVHFFLGGKDALAPMLASGLPLPSEAAMHACWHMVTLLLAWSVVVFVRGGRPAFHFGVLWFGSAIIFIYVGLKQAGIEGLAINPQWTILGLTGILAIWNDRTQQTV